MPLSTYFSYVRRKARRLFASKRKT